ncbi:Cit3 [Kluyveromyces lactis]|nr:Cit3 [Kluyveromyces lactis]
MLKNFTQTRLFHSSRHLLNLKAAIADVIPKRREELLYIKKNFSDVKVGDITIGSVINGMRGNQSMYWESTTLDPNEGIRFHGKTIAECQKLLPGAPEDNGKGEFLPESMLWLLMTGKVPTEEQVRQLTQELAERGAKLPSHTEKLLTSLPRDMHPMTQLAIALASMNKGSIFAEKYQEGSIGKMDYWEYVYEDVLNLIAALPKITGKIYSNIVNDGEPLGHYNVEKDWSYNIASLLGMTVSDSVNMHSLTQERSNDFVNLVRLYCGIHVDHEGGNVSAHTTHLVGSALSDPYLSYSSGIMGLAGPLHGLAAQEVVRFLVEMEKDVDSVENVKQVEEYLWKVLNSSRVIPGYGHAVLRKPDPRFDAMLNFAEKRPKEFKSDAKVQLMKQLSEIAPKVLKEHGKTKNPYPNVDSASGILFYHYGIDQLLFFTVIFGCSRAMGPLSQLVWDRILGLPIERPKSIDLNTIKKICKI